MILRLAVFTQYQSVTDTHTEKDGQIHDDGMYCVSIASRGKNRPYCTRPTKYNATSIGWLNFLSMFPMVVARSSSNGVVIFYTKLHCDSIQCSHQELQPPYYLHPVILGGFVDNVMFSHNGPMACHAFLSGDEIQQA